MEKELQNNIERICAILQKKEVQYLIVGGIAVALHGYYRYSSNADGVVSDKADLDIWYNPTNDNYFRLLNALEDLGQEVSAFKKERTPKPRNSFFKFDFPDFTLDFLPVMAGGEIFREHFKRCEVATIGDVEIKFICYTDLVTMKTKTGREKDIADIEQLEKIKGQEYK